MQSIKSYVPNTKSLCSGQVLHCPYNYEKTKLIIKEMTELLALDLVDKHLVTNQLVLTVGYDIENLSDSSIKYTHMEHKILTIIRLLIKLLERL